jgi:hypothetical protein
VIIGAWSALAVLATIVVFGVAIAATNDVPAVRDFVIALGVLALVAIGALQAVVRQTFTVALYRYATSGSTQGPFAESDLSAPFSRRRGGPR